MNPPNSNKRPLSRGCSEAGFTLIEVVTAVVILAMGITSVLSALNGMTDTHRLMERQTEATLIARDILARVRAQEILPGSEEVEGEIEQTDYRYRVLFNESQYPSLYAISVKVEWGVDEDPDSVFFYTLQYYG